MKGRLSVTCMLCEQCLQLEMNGHVQMRMDSPQLPKRLYFHLRMHAFRMQPSQYALLIERIFQSIFNKFWLCILSGCRVCYWNITYHLCTCAVNVEDYEDWWIISWCSSVAEHWQLKPGACPKFNSWHLLTLLPHNTKNAWTLSLYNCTTLHCIFLSTWEVLCWEAAATH